MNVVNLITKFDITLIEIREYNRDIPSSSNNTLMIAAEVEVTVSMAVVKVAEEAVEHQFLMPFLGNMKNLHNKLYMDHYMLY